MLHFLVAPASSRAAEQRMSGFYLLVEIQSMKCCSMFHPLLHDFVVDMVVRLMVRGTADGGTDVLDKVKV